MHWNKNREHMSRSLFLVPASHPIHSAGIHAKAKQWEKCDLLKNNACCDSVVEPEVG